MRRRAPHRAVFIGPGNRILDHLRDRSDVEVVDHYEPATDGSGRVLLDEARLSDYVATRGVRLWLLNAAPVEVLCALLRQDPAGRHVVLVGPQPRLGSKTLAALRELPATSGVTVVPWYTLRYQLAQLRLLLEMMGAPYETILITNLVPAPAAGPTDPLEGLREPLDALLHLTRRLPTVSHASFEDQPEDRASVTGDIALCTDGVVVEERLHFTVGRERHDRPQQLGVTVTRGLHQVRVEFGMKQSRSNMMIRSVSPSNPKGHLMTTRSAADADNALIDDVVGLLARHLETDLGLPTLDDALRVEIAVEHVRRLLARQSNEPLWHAIFERFWPSASLQAPRTTTDISHTK